MVRLMESQNQLSAQRAMRDADWTSLEYAIREGYCILMVGSDAITGMFDGERLPLLVGLARFVKDKLGPEYAYLNEFNPSSVAQVAIVQEDPFTLQGWAKEFYDGLEATSPVPADLAALPFSLVIDTSPGLSVEQAFLEARPRTTIDYYDRTAPSRPSLADPTVDAPLVYNLYGSLKRPSSLILSDNDRLDFLVSVISGNPPLPAKLRSILSDPDRTFLFLGFQLNQWQFRVMLHVLAQNAQRHFKSFALELDQPDLDAATKLFYKTGHKITFYDMDVESFTAELLRRIGPMTSGTVTAGQGDDLAPDAPLVFLCHASEDSEYADDLARQLRLNGIGTWLDKENLRGGDQWDDVIRRAIGMDVSYVVVIQSTSLKDKDVGYVNREISLALDRQLDYRKNRRFLIPVFIGGSDSLLDDLEHLQSIDLSREGGVDDLIKAINRDLEMVDREP